MTVARDYPLPIYPADDRRFTLALLLEVAEVLAAYGFPPVCEDADLIELRQILFRFLYESEAR